MGKVRQPVKIPSMFYSICRPTVPRGCFFFKEGRGGRDVGEKGKKRRLGIPYRLVDCGVVVHILSNFILLVIWCSLRVSLLYTRHWAMSSACCFIDIFTRPVTQPQEWVCEAFLAPLPPLLFTVVCVKTAVFKLLHPLSSGITERILEAVVISCIINITVTLICYLMSYIWFLREYMRKSLIAFQSQFSDLLIAPYPYLMSNFLKISLFNNKVTRSHSRAIELIC